MTAFTLACSTDGFRTSADRRSSPFMRRQRKGVSLLETVILISAGAVVLAMAVTTFSRFLQVRRAGEDHLESLLQTTRFAQQFRRDVWAASHAEVTTESGLVLTSSRGDTIAYRQDDDMVRRTAKTKERRHTPESFRFPPDTVIRFEATSDEVSAVILPPKQRPVEGDSSHGKPVRITATLGRDMAAAGGGAAP